MGFNYKTYDIEVLSMENFSSNVVNYDYIDNPINNVETTNMSSSVEVLSLDEGRKDATDVRTQETYDNSLETFSFKDRLSPTIAVGLLSLLEGVGQFEETLIDTAATIITVVSTPFAWIYDKTALLYGKNTNFVDDMWHNTKSFVANEYVKGLVDKLYANTEFGKKISKDAYYYDVFRSVGNGVGYVVGVVALTAVTFGFGTISVGSTTGMTEGMGMVGSTAGFGKGTQTAWNDGASTVEGLTYGVGNSVWEGVQFYAGGKISEVGGFGDNLAVKFFKDANKKIKSVSRILLDSLDGGVEGFVQPGLERIYKDGSYKELFEKSGGWKSVGLQAILGAGMSTIGEIGNLGKYFNNTNLTNENVKFDYINNLQTYFDDVDIDNDNKKHIIGDIIDVDSPNYDFVYGSYGNVYRRWKDFGECLKYHRVEIDNANLDKTPEIRKSLLRYGIDLRGCDYSTMNGLLRGDFFNCNNDIITSVNSRHLFNGTTLDLDYFVNSISSEVNSISDFIDENKKNILNIAPFLYSHRIKEPMITYRTFRTSGTIDFLGFDPRGMTLEEFEKKVFEKGDGFESLSFLSSSATSYGSGGGGIFGLVLYNPKDTPGIIFGREGDREEEILFAPNLRYRFVKVEKIKNKFVIHCEVDPSFDFNKAEQDFYKNVEKLFSKYHEIAKNTDEYLAGIKHNFDYYKEINERYVDDEDDWTYDTSDDIDFSDFWGDKLDDDSWDDKSADDSWKDDFKLENNYNKFDEINFDDSTYIFDDSGEKKSGSPPPGDL